jgi:hypothetical protein
VGGGVTDSEAHKPKAWSEMQKRRGIISRFEVRVVAEKHDETERLLVDNGLFAYTCIAQECEACGDDLDDCCCDEIEG